MQENLSRDNLSWFYYSPSCAYVWLNSSRSNNGGWFACLKTAISVNRDAFVGVRGCVGLSQHHSISTRELTLANTKKNSSNKYLFIAMQWRIHSSHLLAIALIQYLYFPCENICAGNTPVHYIVAINPMWHCHFNPIRFHLISFNIYHSMCLAARLYVHWWICCTNILTRTSETAILPPPFWLAQTPQTSIIISFVMKIEMNLYAVSLFISEKQTNKQNKISCSPTFE